ncbi:MAG: tRNA (guanosine(46)-N7)-methyltransferase TrmB, partial [Clostridia bacterium]|nr:tRNA (guanosine(46)-N7)-methyltransferase TrmB [Clostridia bacterium]
IGCGKGRFAAEYAKSHKDINLLAVEKDANVIVSACELCMGENIPNVRFIKCAAEYLEKYVKPQSISGIFLNFSCPFPKNKYASHRLTSARFLEIYKRILLPGARIEQKTDNMHFFEFSVEQLSKAGFVLENISLDLHNSDFEGNIVTEYESRFIAEGLPIYRLEAHL